MNKLLVFIIVFLVYPFYSQIEALFDLKKFHSNENNYIETYLYIYGNTLSESEDSTHDEKGVEILQYIENEEKEIVAHKKYIIKENSDYVEKEGIMDLQRFPIPLGYYNIYVEINYINSSKNIEKHHQEFSLTEPNSPYFSDIELLDSYWRENENEKSELSKSGFHMVPLVTSYFGAEFEKIAYYFEIYKMNLVDSARLCT